MSEFGPGFQSRTMPVDGVQLSVTVGGSGPAILLLHGYTETAQMWKPLAVELAPFFTVIVVDLPGFGDSSIPENGLDMKTAATRVHAAVRALGHERVRVVGHDIGLMVAYAYAALYPQEVEQLTLMDAFLPGVVGWETTYNDPDMWHFRFHGPTPEALVKGRERIYLDHFWNDFAADPQRSVPEASRRAYARAYARPGRMAAGFAYFAAFPHTASDFAQLARTRLAMPVLTIGGEKASGRLLGEQGRAVAENLTVVVIPGAGHWLIEERQGETMAAIRQGLEQGESAQSLQP